jgi:hypothetical protein
MVDLFDVVERTMDMDLRKLPRQKRVDLLGGHGGWFGHVGLMVL